MNPHTPYLIAMLHLAGDSPESRFERMQRETALLYQNGFDAVLVENYYGSVSDCETALAWLHDTYPDKSYGVNILGNESKSFALAAKYHASFIQIDSVAGSLLPNQEEAYDYQLQLLREEYPVCILGGVRFKGHELLSGRSLKGDLEAGMRRCNAVVVTGTATGLDTPIGKIKKYRTIIGNFPLIVGAGVTADTVAEKLKIADGVIVGSWLKEGHTAQGEIREDYVKEFVKNAKGQNSSKAAAQTEPQKIRPKNHPSHGILGLAVGDALGVPAEFHCREALKRNPITTMTGGGTHNQPAGTWSDDTSMTLCLADSLAGGLDYQDIMKRFLSWIDTGAYTPFGETFDCGTTTFSAIANCAKGTPPLDCGGKSERNNGNGSLMRTLPLAYFLQSPDGAHITESDEAMEIIHNVSALTHGHAVSKMACGFYLSIASVFLQTIAAGRPAAERISLGVQRAEEYYQGKEGYQDYLPLFSRLASKDFPNTPEREIKSSGYVIDTLEAAVWCLLTTADYHDCVLKAVNLGEDTDTVACVAGGLAGIIYGYQSIPKEWLDTLVKREFIEDVCERLYQRNRHG